MATVVEISNGCNRIHVLQPATLFCYATLNKKLFLYIFVFLNLYFLFLQILAPTNCEETTHLLYNKKVATLPYQNEKKSKARHFKLFFIFL